MKILMLPLLNPNKVGTDGISRVIEAYHKYLPIYGVQFAHQNASDYDLKVVHAGMTGGDCDVAMLHGLHWTADYNYELWNYRVNAQIVDACRHARIITVPSAWTAETIQRDLRVNPFVIPHGIDWEQWQHDEPQGDYILWNKNRGIGVCDPSPVLGLARRFERAHFVTTFLRYGVQCPDNCNVIGLIPHAQMKKLVQSSLVYLSTTKETFGIGVLEAMASGVPVLGYAHGGNVDLIRHGITGYLAQPGDIDDLAEGLDFCVRHRDTLGQNGREVAREWTWPKACEIVVDVFRRALEPEPPTVAIVIPVYNKTKEEIARAVKSAVEQTYEQLIRVIVVDDGSQDPKAVQAAVAPYQSADARVTVHRQHNSGVAIARNKGIELAGSVKYVACLDADDWIGRRFVELCVEELEADRSLGIAYSALRYYKPDGQTGISHWPDEWDFDKQLQKKNQVPTCCVFQREMWRRLGGYRQRYAPGGAGAEDAEFFLRAGAYGWKAKMLEPVKRVIDMYNLVTYHFQRPATREEVIERGVESEAYDKAFDALFHYSWLSGQVTSDRNYKEVNWLGWHPWVQDGKHPFCSYAKAPNISHPVRQYDEPDVSVIIPVGPGHETEVINALDSLEAQTFRRWEAIVVDDTLKDDLYNSLTAYPYVRFIPWRRFDFNGNIEKVEKPRGAGNARNCGAFSARAPFLVFLDADDWLHPLALERMLEAWRSEKAIVYTDYINRSIINAEYLKEIEGKGLLEGVLKQWQEDGEQKYLAVYRSPVGERSVFNCERAQKQPELDHTGQFYLWCLITSLIPKTWHDAVGGFDESMASFEDVDYHWRLARAGYCYTRVEEPLVVYNYHTGGRRSLATDGLDGRHLAQNLVEYISRKYEDIPVTPCGGCGGRRSRSLATNNRRSTTAHIQRTEPRTSAVDDDFVLAKYVHPRGSINKHQVTGGAQFEFKLAGVRKMRKRGDQRWSIDYGQLQHGDVILVHKADLAAMPGRWEEVRETIAATAPPPEREPLRAPAPISAPAQEMVGVPEPIAEHSQRVDAILNAAAAPRPESTGVVEQVFETPKSETFNLQQLPGIGRAIAEQMLADGVNSKEDILRLGIEGLAQYRGVSEQRAKVIIKALTQE